MIGGLELRRAWRSRRPLIAILALCFFIAMMLLGFYTYAQTETGGRVEFRYTFENRSYFNGLTFALYAFYFGFLLLLPIFAATEAGALIAGDAASRVLWIYLTRPVTRTRLYLSKLGLAGAFLLGLTGLFLGICLLVGLMVVGFGDLDLYPGVMQMTDRPQHIDQADALARFALAWPAAFIALLAPLALSVAVAAWVQSPVNAVGISVSLYLILYVIAEIHFFKDLRPWLFTSYMPYWRELFREDIDWRALLRQGGRLLGFSCVFLSVAFYRLRGREER